jgi:hypothetical protein
MATGGKSVSGCMIRVSDVAQEPLETLAPIGGYENMPLVSIDAAVVPLMTLVPDVNDYVKQAKETYTQKTPPEGLTIDESASIMLYTMEGNSKKNSLYKVLNAVLRSKNRKELPSCFLYLKLLFTALCRLQSTRRFLFRGIKLDLHEDYLENKIVTWWGFSSCAMKVDVLDRFLGTTGARTMFAIDCNSGKDISCFSNYPDEKEVLLLPETQFKVVSSLNQGNGLYTIQLEEIRSPLAISRPVAGANGLNSKYKKYQRINSRSCKF